MTAITASTIRTMRDTTAREAWDKAKLPLKTMVVMGARMPYGVTHAAFDDLHPEDRHAIAESALRLAEAAKRLADICLTT